MTISNLYKSEPKSDAELPNGQEIRPIGSKNVTEFAAIS